jgi:hypothetical protein
MTKIPRAIVVAITFFYLGLLTCTWDKIFKLEIAGFTLKIHQLLFFSSLLATLIAFRKAGISLLLHSTSRGFGLACLLLAIFYVIASPLSYFPLKSALYSGWLLFGLISIWGTIQLLAPYTSKINIAVAIGAITFFNGLVIGIDHIAYKLGYTAGLIGFNQDEILKWGVSRPHAFASEPSYIAVFLCFGTILTLGLFSKLPKKLRLWALPPLAMGIFGITAATSRTGWAALLCSFVLYFTLQGFARKRIPWKGITLLVSGGLISAVVFYASTAPEQRQLLNNNLISSLSLGTDGSGNARIQAHKFALEIARETRWLGTGLGASYKYFTSTRDRSLIAPPNITDNQPTGYELIMSTWGQLLAEGGILAVSLYALAGFFLIRSLWIQWRLNQDPLVLGSLVSAIIFFGFVAFWLGNVARGDVWVWFAIWSRMAMPDSEVAPPQRV